MLIKYIFTSEHKVLKKRLPTVNPAPISAYISDIDTENPPAFNNSPQAEVTSPVNIDREIDIMNRALVAKLSLIIVAHPL